MTLASLLLFASVYTVATASPGPGIAALVARVLARGTKGIGAFVAGFVVGDLVWCGVAIGGFAAMARIAAPVFVALKYGGALYLAYLAWRSWTTRPDAEETAPVGDDDGALGLFAGGLAVTLGNPKVILFFLALLPAVIDLDRLGVAGVIELGAAIVVILGAVLTAYVVAAFRARRLLRSATARRTMNRGAGVVMAGAAAVIATR